MKKSILLKLTATVLCFALLAAFLPLAVSAEESTIHIGVFSDVHYFADAVKGNFCDAYKEFTYLKNKEYAENNALLGNALQGVETVLKQAEEEKANFLLIPGDLTKDGEIECHIELAQKLEAWQARTGIPVFVTNGNHDINNSNVTTFVNGKKEQGTKTSPEQFRQIYANLGFDMADAFFTPKGYPEAKGGMLSYAADLGTGFRLIVVDTSMYSEDNGAPGNEHLTDGCVGDALLEWVCDQAKQAKKNGREPIVMQHHNLVQHMDIEEATFFAFVLRDWERICDFYADAGIHYVFTGHLHASDTASYVNDNGERITDILTPTLTGYPNYFRTVDLTTDMRSTRLDMTNYDIDDERLGLGEITTDFGETIARPYKYTSSYEQTFGNDIGDFVERLLTDLVKNYFTQISEAGGIIPFLKTKDIDVEELLIGLIGTNGISVAGQDILTVRTNAMGLIRDIDSQILEKYINKPEETLAKVMTLVRKLLAFEVSTYPNTYNCEKLDVKNTGKPCTIGEYATTALLLYYGGDENIIGQKGYEFAEDALRRFDSGETTEKLFNLIIEVVVKDLAENIILKDINLNPGALFPDGTVFSMLGKLLQLITVQIFGGDNSLLNIVESVLSIDLVPEKYSSIENILDTLLLKKYFTKSQYEAWGATISWMISTLVFDNNPEPQFDNNITITYSGAEEVEATKANCRLPANTVLNLGEDSLTERTVTWYTKYSIEDSDIELIEADKEPRFTGKATKGSGIASAAEICPRAYPGADLGVFAFLPFYKDYVKHTVTLSGLKPGKTYYYRVGSEERNWWSDTGSFTLPGGKDEAFTFIGIADPSAQRASHFENFAGIMDAATKLYPSAGFTVSTGSQVDYGLNVKQWKNFFNSTDTFLNLPFMPAAGTGENKEAAIKTNFTLPGVPEQDEETGTYYSYDYNNAHFTVLNTNDITDDKLGDAQLDWMKKDISSSDAKWKILVLHKSVYSVGENFDDDDVKSLRNRLGALLPYLGVDLVLSGQDGVYSRTLPMSANCVIPTAAEEETYNGQTYKMLADPKGTVYAALGRAGVSEFEQAAPKDTAKSFPEPECVISDNTRMFAAVTVDGDKLYYSAYQVKDGEAKLADSFGISKAESRPAVKDSTGIIGTLLSEMNTGFLWQLPNFILKILSPVIIFISKIF